MRKLKLFKRSSIFLLASLLALAFTVSADNSPWSGNLDHQKGNNQPDNFVMAMTFISTRPFNSVDGTFFLNGLLGGNGMDFFKNTLGLSDEEIEERRNSVVAFYTNRFGIDVNDPRVYFTSIQVDPAADYRVMMITGKGNNPGKGYPILEGGFVVVVVDPAGLDLGGEFIGTHVPMGAMFAAGGSYVIKTGGKGKDIVINYQSRGPTLFAGTGGIINCEVFHPVWGNGLGWGYFEFHKLTNGQSSAQIRNVLTFPGLGFEGILIGQ